MTPGAVRIALTFTGRCPLRPPAAELRFTAWFRNPGASTTWVVLPDDLSDSAALGSRIGSLDRYELTPGPIHVLHGLGDGGFFALAVPGGQERELRSLPLVFWGDVPDRVTLNLACASTITVGDQPISEALAVELGPEVIGPVDATPLADQRAVVQAIEAPLDAALKIAFANLVTRSLTVELS